MKKGLFLGLTNTLIVSIFMLSNLLFKFSLLVGRDLSLEAMRQHRFFILSFFL